MPYALPAYPDAVEAVFPARDHFLEPRRRHEPVELHLLAGRKRIGRHGRMVRPHDHLILRAGIGDGVARRQKAVQDCKDFAAVAVRRSGLEIGNRVRRCSLPNTGEARSYRWAREAARCRRWPRPAKWPAACAAPPAEALRYRARSGLHPRPMRLRRPAERSKGQSPEAMPMRLTIFRFVQKLPLANISLSSPVAIHSVFAAWMAAVAARRFPRHPASGFWRDNGGKCGTFPAARL